MSSTATTITLSLTQSNDNGGNKIIQHILKRDDGDLSTDINIVVSQYNGVDTVTTVTGLTAGKVYRFNY